MNWTVYTVCISDNKLSPEELKVVVVMLLSVRLMQALSAGLILISLEQPKTSQA
jgi:hypothetical protein